MEELECPVCLTLPEGEVHQCNEGHCYCVDCWNRLDPRRCPECRQPIQDSNRNRDREARIAALEASCDHCAKPTTRGTKASHMRVCPQRPTACAGAAAGCSWLGVAAEQAAHEAACTIAVCQRMMGPLQARCDGLQSQNQQLQARSQELQARVGSLEPLQAQNQQLQRQVAALQPLTGRVRALEGDAEAGGQQQRQRVRAAPHVDDARVFKVRVRAGDLVDYVVSVDEVVLSDLARLDRLARLCAARVDPPGPEEDGHLVDLHADLANKVLVEARHAAQSGKAVGGETWLGRG